MKSCNKYFILSLILLLDIALAQAVATDNALISDQVQPMTVKYTANTKETCNGRRCSIEISPAQKYYLEEGAWKRIEEVTDFRNVGIQCEIEKSLASDPDVECLSYNLTSISLRISSPSTVPVKIYQWKLNESKQLSRELVYTDRIAFTKTEIKEFTFQVLQNTTLYAYEIHIGSTSTTINLQSHDDQLIASQWIDSSNPSTVKSGFVAESVVNASGVQFSALWKYNISAIPAGATIVNATWYGNINENKLDAGESLKIYIHHLYPSYEWARNTTTWNSRPVVTTNFNQTPMDTVLVSVSTGTDVFLPFNVLPAVRENYNNGYKNVSFYVDTGTASGSPNSLDYISFYGWYMYVMDTQQISYLNITYDTGGSPQNNDFITVNLDKNTSTPSSIWFNWSTSGNYSRSQVWRDGSLVHNNTNTFFNDTGLASLTGYYYNITAVWNSTLKNSTAFVITTASSTAFADETTGRNAIETGVNGSGLSSPVIDTDVVVYVVYQNGTQKVGQYDKFASSGNKRWAFNYLTDSDVLQGLLGLQSTLFIWENQSLTSQQIEQQVSGLINITR